MLENFRFENPMAFQLLWLVPVFLIIIYLNNKMKEKKANKTIDKNLYDFLTSSVSNKKRKWKIILRTIILVLFIFCLARPQVGKSQKKVKSEGIEIMLLVDVSNSMLAEDIKPSRLEFAKKELSRLIGLSGGDRIGLVAFAGSAILLSPVTQDKSALNMYIESLSPDTVSTQGTEFKKALIEAGDAFARGGIEGDTQTVVTRAVIVISDGEDNEPGALEAAKKLASKGIRIFSLGVGTEKGAPIPIRDKWGNLKNYRKDKNGKTILTKTKGTILKNIAKEGKGAFYHATFGSNAVKSIYSDIEKLERAAFDSMEVSNYDDKYQYPLFTAILLALFELFLGERKSPGRLWRGRFEVSDN